MSKKKSINKTSADILKGVGERLKNQKSKKKNNLIENINNKKQEKNITTEKKETKKNKIDSEDAEQYKTTFMVKPKYERIYMEARFKVRKNLKALLTKQDALEIGLLLLDNIDEDIYKRVIKNYSSEENLIQVLKEVIERS